MSEDRKPNEDIVALRSILFDTLHGLKNKTLDVQRAEAIRDVAQVIVNSAKVEVDAMKVSGGVVGKDNSFFKALPNGTNGVTIHKIR